MKIIEDLLAFVFAGFATVFEWVFHLIEKRLGIESNKPTSSPHNSKFISSSKVLKKKNTGFCLDGKKQLSSEDSHRHAIIYGPSGTGKSKVVIQPTIYRVDGSMIIFDPAGDLFRASSGYLSRKKGYVVKRINYEKPVVSDGFNPLSYAIKKGQTGINQLSDLVVKIALGESKDGLYWNKNAVNLLRLLIRVVQTRDPKYHTFAYIYHLISILESNTGNFLTLVEESHNPHLISQVKALTCS
ncbi:MAG: type IV secretory system conjugative DNA transfer family protein [Bacteroidia bacterium]